MTLEKEAGLRDADGRLFREAWIAGVRRHYPGEPKAGYVSGWDDTPHWERRSAAARLTREQKGRFVSLTWIGQIFAHFPDPKPSYVADWDALPEWQRETDADIFEAVERSIGSSTSP